MNSRNMERIDKDHAPSVYKYLLSITHDAGLAEELTQETFYRAIYSIDNFNGACKISVWLCHIAKHIWFQELRKKTKYKTQELDEDISSPSHWRIQRC